MTISVVDYRDPDAAAQFATSLKETGFGVLSHHPIDQALIDENFAAWEAFFNADDRYDYAFDEESHAGYIDAKLSESAKGNALKDLKEFYHYYRSGKCPARLSEQTQRLFDAMTELASTLLTWVENNLPEDVRKQLSMSLPDMITACPYTLLRILYYPALTGKEEPGAVRAAEHGDINLITLLPAATAAGLQAKTKTGEWVDVPINKNWIIVNVGDMLEECTGHYYPSTLHRVINPEGVAASEPRLSMPLFLHANCDVVLSERHTAKSYRTERWIEVGLLEPEDNAA